MGADLDNSQRKLARLKAEQRAQAAREAQLRNLIDSDNSDLEEKLAIFKTLIHTEQERFNMALSKMLDKTDPDE